jgi:hypothetical protein
MKKTLDDFFESTENLKDLKEGLAINIEMLCPELAKEQAETLLRLNLILIRQALRDYGAE